MYTKITVVQHREDLTCDVVGLVNADGLTVLPFPGDCWLGTSGSVALQGDVGSLRLHLVPAAQVVLNFRWD